MDETKVATGDDFSVCSVVGALVVMYEGSCVGILEDSVDGR